MTEWQSRRAMTDTSERIHLPVPCATLAVRSLIILCKWQMLAIVSINQKERWEMGMKMEDMGFFEKAAERFGLGKLTGAPRRVTGGYMHKMFRLETVTGTFALKLLNPSIMKRPEVFENYRKAEELERILCDNAIPLIPALERDGTKMQCLDGRYFYLFDWSDGKALGWHEIRQEHCEIVGGLLAGIHRIEKREIPYQGEKLDTDWDDYIRKAQQGCPEIALELTENRDILYAAQEAYNTAQDSAPGVSCICDGDMDCKNVLWEEGKPFLIDLECLSYGNPYLEMFQLALSWAGGDVCDMDFGRFEAFVSAYRTQYGEMQADWRALSGVGFGWLDWLAYNLRRALGMECSDEEERKLGIREAHETIQRIVYYSAVREELLEYIRGFLA